MRPVKEGLFSLLLASCRWKSWLFLGLHDGSVTSVSASIITGLSSPWVFLLIRTPVISDKCPPCSRMTSSQLIAATEVLFLHKVAHWRIVVLEFDTTSGESDSVPDTTHLDEVLLTPNQVLTKWSSVLFCLEWLFSFNFLIPYFLLTSPLLSS